MKRRWKVLGGLGALALAGVGVLAGVLSHRAACPAPPPPAEGTTMQAWMARCYGAPDVLTFETLPVPVLADDRVLVRVRASAGNPLDWHGMRGEPRIMRLSSGIGAPEDPRFGTDFAGVVEAVGPKVSGFAPGDRVFGVAPGAFAQYVVVNPARMAKIPDGIDFAQAAAVPVAGVTALQAVRDGGQVCAPGSACWSTAPLAGSGTTASSWRITSARMSLGSAVDPTWRWSAISAPTRSSTTPRPIRCRRTGPSPSAAAPGSRSAARRGRGWRSASGCRSAAGTLPRSWDRS